MADQVNPLGSLASGLPLALLAASAPKPAPEKVRTAKVTDSQPQRRDDRTAAEPAKSFEAAMEQLNNHLEQANSDLKFKVDKVTGRTFFQVINEKTGEVVLQVPSEEMLTMARKLRELEKQMGASGVLVDKEG